MTANLADSRYETAIATRNERWALLEAARNLLGAAERQGVPDLPFYVRNYNRALDAYEWAERDLDRERALRAEGRSPIAL
jgi:hypothetical protein